jgi:hypothetical protein
VAREDEIAAILAADATLTGILTGGILTSGTVGEEGLSRTETPAVFDAAGYLKPVALVRQRGLVPNSQVKDFDEQITSATQVVEVWLYQDSGYVEIDAAKARIYTLLQGRMLAGTFELDLVNLIERQRDQGALRGASLTRMDWAVYSILEPTEI